MIFPTSLLSRLTDVANRHNQVRSQADYDGWLPPAEEVVGIPHHIFQICLRGREEDAETVYNSLPDSFKNNIKALKELNPGWDYHLICDKEANNFILRHYGDTVYDYYSRIDAHYGAARADFLRYLLLYEFGGVYLDLKSTVTESLSGHLRGDDRFLLFYWDIIAGGNHHCLIPDYIEGGEILQGFIISAKRHPFLRSVITQVLKNIDNYNPYTDGIGWTGVLNVCGPAMYTKAIYNETLNASAHQPALYRKGRPFQDFGYLVSFYQATEPGAYQKNLSLRDYRKETIPVVVGPNGLLNFINRPYLKILSRR